MVAHCSRLCLVTVNPTSLDLSGLTLLPGPTPPTDCTSRLGPVTPSPGTLYPSTSRPNSNKVHYTLNTIRLTHHSSSPCVQKVSTNPPPQPFPVTGSFRLRHASPKTYPSCIEESMSRPLVLLRLGRQDPNVQFPPGASHVKVRIGRPPPRLPHEILLRLLRLLRLYHVFRFEGPRPPSRSFSSRVLPFPPSLVLVHGPGVGTT